MTAGMWWFAAQAAAQTFSSIQQHQQAEQQAQIQREGAFRQVAENNRIGLNNQIYINDLEALELKKHGLDSLELSLQVAKARSSQLALQASQGAGLGKSGNTAEQIIQDISRQGANSIARKELNFSTQLRDFQNKRTNAVEQNLSANSAAFSNLSIGPSKTGLALEILGNVATTAIASKQG
jgi:hypothetical protein